MYAGHVGIALGFRSVRGAPPLWLLVLAAQGPDWGDMLHEALRLPFGNPGWSSHSFPMVGVGALGAGAVAWLVTRRGGTPGRAALIAAVAYLSHWLADFFTGNKPTWPGGPVVGLGLYSHPLRDLALEGAVIVCGWWLWRRALPRPGGRLSYTLLAALLACQGAAFVSIRLGLLE